MIASWRRLGLVLWTALALGCSDEGPGAQPRPVSSSAAQPPEVPLPTPVAAPAEPRQSGGVNAPACRRKAAELIRRGKACGVDMGKYSPEGICSYYRTTEQFTDEQAVRRLDIFMEDGCTGLRAAVEGDRI